MNGKHGKAPAPQPGATLPKPIPYPHGGTDQERRAYVDKIEKCSPDYYCLHGNWNLKGTTKNLTGEVALVEVWEDLNADKHGHKIHHHPSRHRFRPVTDPSQNGHWRSQATTNFQNVMVALKNGRKVPQQVLQTLGLDLTKNSMSTHNDGNDYYKSENTPAWALIPANVVIGYTSKHPVQWVRRPPSPNPVPISTPPLSLDSLPSVYFKNGHLTTQHITRENMGWSNEDGTCLFFGNVLEDYIDRR